MRLIDVVPKAQRTPMTDASGLVQAGRAHVIGSPMAHLPEEYRRWKTNSTDYRKNPVARDMADILPWVWYSRFVVDIGQPFPDLIEFFTVPVNTNAATLRDTNLRVVSQLASPQRMNVQGLGFRFATDNDKTDIDVFLRDYVTSFVVTDKPYTQGPAYYYPGASGLSGVTTQTAQSAYNNGNAFAGNYWNLCLPQGLPIGKETITDDETGEKTENILYSSGYDGIRVEQTERFLVSATRFNPTPPVTLARFEVEVGLFNILSRAVN